MKATFHLITGFLGSGKTTLLDRLLRELSGKRKIAVIQNEFAPTGVDGKELKRNNDGFHLVEINNGSVFCVCQLGTFHKTMEQLLDEVQPEMIFLEASGLADPISIIDLLFKAGLDDRLALGRVISLVDAPNFFRGLSGLQRFRHQLMVADTVLINKLDLFAGDLEAINTEIRQLNPFAEILTASYADVGWNALGSGSTDHAAARAHQGAESGGRPGLPVCVLRTHDPADPAGLERFLRELQPTCPRIKGFLNLSDGRVVAVNSVYDQLEIQHIESYSGPSELIAFGEGLTVRGVRQRFKACTALNWPEGALGS